MSNLGHEIKCIEHFFQGTQIVVPKLWNIYLLC